jgi:hypothetical protein
MAVTMKVPMSASLKPPLEAWLIVGAGDSTKRLKLKCEIPLSRKYRTIQAATSQRPTPTTQHSP